ncbi:MAG: hypothetical protein JSR65_12465 [Proteobacteria bacterium]|nr:hypothetical protein [Pseudomonadota bacterium]
MKRTSLTTAVIAGIAGVAGISNMASAVYLNNDGLGQVLIYPYYTVNSGNITLMTVVNTTNQGKAIKVRYLEAYNSREVLDFNLYMSPRDVWTSAIVPVGAGAGVFSPDNSCTVPPLPTSAATAQPFLTYAFDGTGGDASTGIPLPADAGPQTVSRTLEGYVELIEMGTVTGYSLSAITHRNGVPANCSVVQAAWNPGGYWANNANVDITSVSGGLFGSGAIINVNAGQISGYNADAVDQFWLAGSASHTQPGSLSPNISSATNTTSYVFAPSPVTTTPSLATTPYFLGVDAVSSLFMADQVYNEYWTGGGTSAASEWVITFPTKRFYVDAGSGATSGHMKPFDVFFSGTRPNGRSCAPIAISVYDREEKSPTTQIGFSPAQAQAGTALCFESQVVTFNQPNIATTPSAILGSRMTANITGAGNVGWATVDLYKASTANHVLAYGINGNTFNGLPVTGFWVTNFINGNVGGVLSNYSALFRHKLHRVCSLRQGICS